MKKTRPRGLKDRRAADRARERVIARGEATVADRRIAATWYRLLGNGQLTELDLARLLSSVRFDAAYCRQMERELAHRDPEFRRELEQRRDRDETDA